jgi:formyltetrahydrofolate deformylase
MTVHYLALNISCPDRVGIIAAVSGFIAQHGGFIVKASYHTEYETQHFFMRNLPLCIRRTGRGTD